MAVLEQDAQQLQVRQWVSLLGGCLKALLHQADQCRHQQCLAISQGQAKEHQSEKLLHQHSLLKEQQQAMLREVIYAQKPLTRQ
jgi:hypothetical protein